MPWRVIYRDEEPEQPAVGDIFPAADWAGSNMISDAYLALPEPRRPPLIVILPSKYPGGDRFLVDRKPSDKKTGGWDVTIQGEMVDGQQLDITLHPSINCEGSYHGYIRQGVITNDCEGRKFSNC